jgi:hypothetical protein
MKTQDFTVTELIGHWRVRWSVLCFDWIFRNDGSFVGKFAVIGIPILRLTGTWSIDGDKLLSIYDRHYLIAGGLKDTDTLLEVAQDYFILVTRRGTRRRWERVYERPAA